MLRFKARRKDPTEAPFLTPSQKRIMASLGTAMTKVRNAAIRNEGQILDAILHGPPARLIALVPEDPWYAAQEEMQTELTGELLDAGQRYGALIPSVQKATVTFRFDAERPEAAAWASKEAATMIVEVVEEQRGLVRDLATRASMGELTPRDAARQIRDVIGLTREQAGWVQNYRARQVAELQAQGLSPSRVAQRADQLTDRYHARIHRYRSENIARTEILRASNEGREQAWGQALNEGFISPNSSKQWSANQDGRICDQCAALDGTVVPLAGTFPGGNPPLHPSCRCDVLLLPDVESSQALAPSMETSFDSIAAKAEEFVKYADERGYTNGDPILERIYSERGYDARPQVVRPEQLERMAGQGSQILYRGVSEAKYLDELRDGPYFPGFGNFGNGTYSSTAWETGVTYGRNDPDNVISFTLASRARVANYDELSDEWTRERVIRQSYWDQRIASSTDPLERERLEALKDAEDVVTGDLGRYAAMKGYDAFETGGLINNEVYVIVLNRGSMIVSSTNGRVNAPS